MYKYLLLLQQAAFFAAAPTLPAQLEPRTCSPPIQPTNFYSISSQNPTVTQDYGPVPPQNFFNFKIEQTGNGKSIQSEDDLIATYANVPCPSSGGSQKSVKLEFFFQPISDYAYSYNTRIDVFAIKGKLPRNSAGVGVPTWNNLKAKRGGLIASFTMPQSEDQVRKVIKIASVACAKELNFRLSIANSGYQSGLVWYSQRYPPDENPDTGLRIRYGC